VDNTEITQKPVERISRRLGQTFIGEGAIRAILGVPEGVRVLAVHANSYGIGDQGWHPVPEGIEPPRVTTSWVQQSAIVDGETYTRLEWS
jgi:hypothetical protein